MHRIPQWFRRVWLAQRALDGVQTPCASTRVLTASRCAPLILTIALSSVLDTAHGADIYRWKDDNNVTTFSQLPPVDGVYVERLLRPSRIDSTALSATSALGRWHPVLPPPVSVERVLGVESSGIRPAETPAEQELRERHEEVSVVSPRSLVPRQRRTSQWIEISAQPRRSPRR